MTRSKEDKYEFPGDRQCKTLKEIHKKVEQLSDISEVDRKDALASVKKLLKILKCEK